MSFSLPNMSKTTIAGRLREIMADLDMRTARDLAVFLGISEGRVSQILNGSDPSIGLGPKPLKALESKTTYRLEWITDGKLPKRRKAVADLPSGALDPSNILDPFERIKIALGDLLIVGTEREMLLADIKARHLAHQLRMEETLGSIKGKGK